jgi:ABC-type multidrug transport system ATPase subunit
MKYFNLNIDFNADISILSSGQIQKMMLILSMLSDSEIVLIDEPDQNQILPIYISVFWFY